MTAQSAYAALGSGFVTAVLTLAAGPLYTWFGARGFWAMALLCAVAVPLALTLRLDVEPSEDCRLLPVKRRPCAGSEPPGQDRAS